MLAMVPKNDVERLGVVLVTERSSANRYMCTKCFQFFWGSRVRILKHFLPPANDATGPGQNRPRKVCCTGELTEAEREALHALALVCEGQGSRGAGVVPRRGGELVEVGEGGEGGGREEGGGGGGDALSGVSAASARLVGILMV
jgi:hypothetical protein